MTAADNAARQASFRKRRAESDMVLIRRYVPRALAPDCNAAIDAVLTKTPARATFPPRGTDRKQSPGQ
jgi:hypothetical protein